MTEKEFKTLCVVYPSVKDTRPPGAILAVQCRASVFLYEDSADKVHERYKIEYQTSDHPYPYNKMIAIPLGKWEVMLEEMGKEGMSIGILMIHEQSVENFLNGPRKPTIIDVNQCN
jgi:hypothetical protein